MFVVLVGVEASVPSLKPIKSSDQSLLIPNGFRSFFAAVCYTYREAIMDLCGAATTAQLLPTVFLAAGAFITQFNRLF